MITLEEYLMGRDKQAPLTIEMHIDALSTVAKANELLEKFGSMRRVTSGYRPSFINEHIKNAARHSNHMVCRAIDLADGDGKLDEFCTNNLKLLDEIGLWLELPKSTPGWAHVQIVPPKSGNRVFIP